VTSADLKLRPTGEAGLLRFAARLVDRLWHEIQADRLPTLLGQEDDVRTGAAAQVEGRAGRDIA
jgi:hypothetical protein